MLDWILKNKSAGDPEPAPAGGQPSAAPAAPDAEWDARLQQARGDDEALLALARGSAPLATKLAAVEALTGEAALKVAEREFRSHDRRVHRLAKQRHQALVAQRQTRARAADLIDAARALAAAGPVAVNRAVELDRAWAALDAALVDADQAAEYGALTAQLSALARERAERDATAARWQAEARRALQALQAAVGDAAAGTLDRAGLAAAVAAAQAAADAGPDGRRDAALDAGVAAAGALDARIALLDSLVTAPPDDPAAAWQQLAPVADGRVGALLDERFAAWQQAQDDSQRLEQAQRRQQQKDRQRTLRGERNDALAALLQLAETALDEGHLVDAQRRLSEVDALLHDGAPTDPLRARVDLLQARYAQLRGWQSWSGGRARDELTLQAEALAAATDGDARTLKLSIQQRTELIDDLRARWKELDRLGAAGNRALWQRFEAALKTAFQPVAAQRDAQRAAREQNLAARRQLIAGLDALPLADDGAAPDTRLLARALEQFQTEWRKLGPVEHTVPHKARDELVERMQAAVRRLEAPLGAVRAQAQAEREALVERARSLAAAAAAGAHGREIVDDVRALQADWQQHARSQPLARAAEQALWTQFKAATDAVFSARDALFSARDAEFKANATARMALIERLEGLADAPAPELKRALADVDAQWARSGPAPRSDAAALDARYAAARDGARRWLAGSAQRDWDAACDALVARLVLCDALEAGAPDADGADAETRWSALPPLAQLPPAWDQTLRARAGIAGAAAPPDALGALAVDDLLLQLEAAWGLPSPPAFEDARRALKLQAMKAAMESRRVAQAPPPPEQLFASALRRSRLDDGQRARLGAVIEAMRRRGAPRPA